MVNHVIAEDRVGFIASKARVLVKELGYQVHYQPLKELLLEKGMKETTSGRLVCDDALIDGFVAFQSARQAAKKQAASAQSAAHCTQFKMMFGNMTPKYHNYSTGTPELARMEHLQKMVKFAHQEERIGRVGMPFSVTDVPVATAPIEAFLNMVKLTDKYQFFIDPFREEVVKYLAELSDVFLGVGHQKEFIDSCNCINPIMRLEERTGATMMEKAKYDVPALMTSMPAAGGNSPVTLDGTIIQGTAEVLGGVVISYLLNPDADHIGYISSGAMDLKTAVTTQSSPETVLVDCGVVQVMEQFFGGNTRIGGFSFIASRRPGLVAVYEKMFKTAAYQKYTGDLVFTGIGVLENGGMLSPEQLVLDMDIAESFFRVREVPVRDEGIEKLIMEVEESGSADFLSTEHTLENFRDAFWEPSMFGRGDTLPEKEMLDKAHGYFTSKVESYSGYEYEEDKVAACEDILARAKKELL